MLLAMKKSFRSSFLSIVLFLALAVGASSTTALAAPILFNIVGGDLSIAFDPSSDGIVDQAGVLGMPGRKLRVGSLNLRVLPNPANQGIVDAALGTITYAVDLKADFAFFDYASGAYVKGDSFSTFINEMGSFNPFTDNGTLDGDGPIRPNGDTILAGWWKNLWEELKSGSTLIGFSVDELSSGALTPITYNGSTTPGFNEIEINISPDFGGGALHGTTSGALIATIPEPNTLALVIGPLVIGLFMVYRNRAWRSVARAHSKS